VIITYITTNQIEDYAAIVSLVYKKIFICSSYAIFVLAFLHAIMRFLSGINDEIGVTYFKGSAKFK